MMARAAEDALEGVDANTSGAEVPVVWIALGVALLAGALVITRVGRRMCV